MSLRTRSLAVVIGPVAAGVAQAADRVSKMPPAQHSDDQKKAAADLETSA